MELLDSLWKFAKSYVRKSRKGITAGSKRI